MTQQLYEIYMSKGTGVRHGPRFRHIADAVRYVEAHRPEASFAIKRPDGSWFVVDEDGHAIFERSCASRRR